MGIFLIVIFLGTRDFKLLNLEMGSVCAIIPYVSHDRSFILVARFTTFNVEPAIPKPSYSCATVLVDVLNLSRW